MSDYLYALIPYDYKGEIRPEDPDDCFVWQPFIPELQGVPSKLAERDGLDLFPGFLLINTCYSMSMILPDEDGPSPSRREVFKIVQALGATEAWYVSEDTAFYYLILDSVPLGTVSLESFKALLKGELNRYFLEYSPELTDCASVMHDDFRDLKELDSLLKIAEKHLNLIREKEAGTDISGGSLPEKYEDKNKTEKTEGEKSEKTEQENRTASEIIRILKEKTGRKSAEMKFYKQKTSVTSSRLGGIPFIPKGGEYPVNRKTGEKLFLLVQINFAEMPEVPDYPSDGILQIFLGTDGWREDNPESLKAIYYEDTSSPMPEDEIIGLMPVMPKDCIFPLCNPGTEYSIKFKAADMPIQSSDFRFSAVFAGYCRDAVPEELKCKKHEKSGPFGLPLPFCYHNLPYDIRSITGKELSVKISRIGGYPSFVQCDPRGGRIPVNCELLLQLNSDMDNEGKMAMMWGDQGSAYFFIDPEDLRKKDFSKVYYTWDCY